MKAAILALALAFVASGCRTDQSAATCADQARLHGPEFTVAGAVATTVAKVRDLQPQMQPPRWPELTPESAAVLCYLDGPFGDAPGGGEPYDRGVVAVAGEHADLVILGYRSGLPVPTP